MTLVDAGVFYAELMQPGRDGQVSLLAQLLSRPAWMVSAACAGEPPGRFFVNPQSKRARRAIEVCRRCPVRQSCLDFALEHEEVGIWGGTTDRERRQMLAERGNPRSTPATG